MTMDPTLANKGIVLVFTKVQACTTQITQSGCVQADVFAQKLNFISLSKFFPEYKGVVQSCDDFRLLFAAGNDSFESSRRDGALERWIARSKAGDLAEFFVADFVRDA